MVANTEAGRRKSQQVYCADELCKFVAMRAADRGPRDRSLKMRDLPIAYDVKVARKLDIGAFLDGFTIQFDVRRKAFWTCSRLFWELLVAPLNSIQIVKDMSPSRMVFVRDRCNEQSRFIVIVSIKNRIAAECGEHVPQNSSEPHYHVNTATNLYRFSLFFKCRKAVMSVHGTEYAYRLDKEFEPPFQL
ncbi:hypothetical protein FVE85_5705 [Porphyridium purpureum]|uniref:Uncharacterized protein n=1 Tax=Porphyridium purpureum TaxID=35688 RepID=A0A5J4Z4B5_PORPP|nr:hypothetical protein FVE85_5705 [Porphyridium purpureum]|eukprot:POR4631..scf295_1